MTETKQVGHTPGPWTADAADRVAFQVGQPVGAIGMHHVADVIRTGDEAQDTANARLIAAAPELLEALEAIAARLAGDFDHPSLKRFGPLSIGRLEDADRFARAAIAKATGGEAAEAKPADPFASLSRDDFAGIAMVRGDFESYVLDVDENGNDITLDGMTDDEWEQARARADKMIGYSESAFDIIWDCVREACEEIAQQREAEART